jgi:hypothetical protein
MNALSRCYPSLVKVSNLWSRKPNPNNFHFFGLPNIALRLACQPSCGIPCILLGYSRRQTYLGPLLEEITDLLAKIVQGLSSKEGLGIRCLHGVETEPFC